jgi:RNA polymerase sigma-70 factor (ECF subfamily)
VQPFGARSTPTLHEADPRRSKAALDDIAVNSAESPDDRALVAEFLRSRSEEAFVRLYDRHAPMLYRFAARLAGGPGIEPAELVQEAWVRAIERLALFRWESSLRTWLCGIVLNRWREVRRGSERDRTVVALAEREPERPASDLALRRRLDQALGELAEGYRTVLLLHDVEGYTHEEIARHFGIAEGTSKSQLHRARRALRDAFEARGAARHGG